jgi:hypothetical protein
MGRRIAKVEWASAEAGPVLAVVHPGGILLTTPIVVHGLEIAHASELELRVELRRYAAEATAGTVLATYSLADDGTSGKAVVRYGQVTWPGGSPNLVEPARLSSRGALRSFMGAGALKIENDHTLVLWLLDAVPFAASHPIAFYVDYED